MATVEEYNQQIADLLTEGFGTTIPVGTLTPIPGSKKISWGDVKKRIEEGLPLNEGELFPSVPSMPDGSAMDPTRFLRLAGIPGGASFATQSPFSSFETDIAFSGTQQQQQVPTNSNVSDAPAILAQQKKKKEIVDQGDTGNEPKWQGSDYVSPYSFGERGGGAFGIVHGIMKVGSALAEVGFGTGFSEEGYMPYATLNKGGAYTQEAFNRGDITAAQYSAYLSRGDGYYYDNGQDASGAKGNYDPTYQQVNLMPVWNKELQKWGFEDDANEEWGNILANNAENLKKKKKWWETVMYDDDNTHDDHKPGKRGDAIGIMADSWGNVIQILQNGNTFYKGQQLSGRGAMSYGLSTRGVLGSSFVSDTKKEQDELIKANNAYYAKVMNNWREFGKTTAPFGDDDAGGGELSYVPPSLGLEQFSRPELAGSLAGSGVSYADLVQDLGPGHYVSQFGDFSDLEGYPVGSPIEAAPSLTDYPGMKATVTEDSGDEVDAPYDPGGGWSETVSGGGEFMMASGGRVGMQEGGMPMPPQEGAAPPMPMQQPPQEGAPADMSNLGMINEQAAAPQEGGQQSVQDDVPREADEGDYILPYETVLLVGLKQLNRYAREAIKLAMKNGIDLAGTDLDPTDDVPIKVSNYEFHIPKVLVPFFGGGKKYLDKIREEGLALRKRLEEEKQPSAEQQQPQPTAQPAPPQLEAAPAAPPQAAPPMMQKGGFVLNPNEQQQQTPTTAAILERDTSQPTQESATYNQLKALQRSQKTQQQPPMVDPTGKIIPQGFAAPQGYQMGSMVENPEVAQAAEPKTEPPMPDWANRALDPKTPVLMNEETGEPQTLGLITDEINKMFHVYPTIRMVGKELKRYDQDEALSISMKKKDSVKFKTQQEADSWSTGLVDQIAKLRDLQQPSQPDLVEPLDAMPPPMEEEGGGAEMPPMPEEEAAMPPLPVEGQPGFAQQPMIA